MTKPSRDNVFELSPAATGGASLSRAVAPYRLGSANGRSLQRVQEQLALDLALIEAEQVKTEASAAAMAGVTRSAYVTFHETSDDLLALKATAAGEHQRRVDEFERLLSQQFGQHLLGVTAIADRRIAQIVDAGPEPEPETPPPAKRRGLLGLLIGDLELK